MLIAASHSHSAPTAKPLRQWGRVDEVYVQALEAHLAGAVRVAHARAVEARLGWDCGAVTTISENRRGGHAQIDPGTPVLRFDDRTGQPCWDSDQLRLSPPVSLHSYRNLLSPDYPGTMRDVVAHVLEKSVPVLFTLGTSGDINPAGYVAGETTPARSRQLGSILGCEVAKVALESAPCDVTELRVAQATVELPLAPLPPVTELQEMHRRFATEAAQRAEAGAPWADVSVAQIKRDWAAEALAVREQDQPATSRPCELLALRLGNAAILALPLEVFVETGLAIKEASPAALTLISTNSNGGVGYLPTRDAYASNDYTNPGGLAPKVYGLYALAAEAEPLVRERAAELLQTLWK